MAVFDKQELIKPTFLHKIFKKLPKDNYIIEVQNLLAEYESDLLSLNKEDIEILRQKYKINLKAFLNERSSLLDRYLNYCFHDYLISDKERKILSHLSYLLDLSNDYLTRKIKELGKIVYQKKVQEIIANYIITDNDREQLTILRDEFGLSDEEGQEIYNEACRKMVQEYIDSIIANHRMSPDEEKKLNEMISGLNIKAYFEGNGLRKLRLFWDIENAELPAMISPINLHKNELLYYSANIEWHEERTKTTMISYHGITWNVRLIKGMGIKSRAGWIFPKRHTEEYMKLIDIGEVFFTNKRIIFMGSHGNKTISWSKILAIYPFADGIQLDKDTGKKPFFKCSDPELMGMYILRILKDF